MATNGVEAFLRAEEEADRLVDELVRLKEETESYTTARVALDQAAKGARELATRLADIAERLGGVGETLRSIGTPELLRAQEAVSAEVAALRQDLDGTQRSITAALAKAMGEVHALRESLEAGERSRREEQQGLQQAVGALATAQDLADVRQALEQRDEAGRQEAQAIKEDLSAQVAAAIAAVGAVRNLALGTVSLLLLALLVLGWLALSLARG